MTIRKAQGSTLAIGTAFGATKAISNMTNANPSVFTFEASHGIVVNDIFHLVTSNWSRAQDRVFRASAVATNDVSAEGFNASSTTDYPPGDDTATAREITTWTTISQLFDVAAAGGGFRKREITQWSDTRVKNLPLLADSSTLTFKAFADRQASWFDTLVTVGRSGAVYPYRITGQDGSLEYGAAYIGFTGDQVPEDGVYVWTIELEKVGDPTFYAA